VSEQNFILNYQNTSGKNFKFLCFVDNKRMMVNNVIATYLIIIIISSSSSSSSSISSSYYSYVGECWMIGS
jgi:CRISPR/Cas system endoribonuclease Cas6 (RAMP superfamily)